jgi:hypothetical protein
MFHFITQIVTFIFVTISQLFGVYPYIEPTPIPPQQVLPASPVTSEPPAATSTKQTVSTPPKTVSSKKPIAQNSTPPPPQPVSPPVEPVPDFEKINQTSRAALVNILCLGSSGSIPGISGTGVIIDPRGVILTNAHIAQYFLLKDYPQKNSLDCVIRTGSPAIPQYRASLTYISPTWVDKNKTVLKESEPRGTGEDDFAFLLITKSTSGSPLPSSFPYIPFSATEILDENQTVLLASYPAGFLSGQTLLQSLNVASAITNIQKVFTFKEDTIDLLAVGGTVVSQKGASGGAVVSGKSELIGIITTSSQEETTSSRQLNAITSAYINRALQNELGISLLNLLSQNISEFTEKFQNTTAPLLTKAIVDELSK